MKAWLSILGLYNYDDSIFDKFVVPTGMDKELIINNILLELAELEVIYPEPNTMKNAIGFWSQGQLDSWQRMYDAMQLEYDPIYNYDRFEEWLDSNQSHSNSTGTSNGTSKHQVNAFNKGLADSDNTIIDDLNPSIAFFTSLIIQSRLRSWKLLYGNCSNAIIIFLSLIN